MTRKHNCVSIVWFQGARITFAGQVANHVNTVSQVVDILGDENQAANYLSKCIYSIGLGSNDYLNNYFMPLYYSTGNQYSPDSFANDLINRYTEQLRVRSFTRAISSVSSVFVSNVSVSSVFFFCLVWSRYCITMERGSLR